MNLKHVLIGAVIVALCLLGGLWVFLRQVPPSETLTSFQQTCIEGQRRGISGDTRPLDEPTETRMLAFCDCVAQEASSRLTQQDIAAIGLDRGSPTIDAKLEAIFASCEPPNP